MRVSSAGGFLGYLEPGVRGGWRRATAAAAVKAAVKPAVGVGNGVGFEVEAR